MMPTKRSFKRWLFAQKRRNDPVGDLARDARADRTPPKPFTPGTFRAYLVRICACDGALEALDRAKSEWKGAR